MDERFVQWLVEERWPEVSGHFNRLWEYYQNPVIEQLNRGDGAGHENSKGYIQAQEKGLPARITGMIYGDGYGSQRIGGIQRKEVVIENDIGWRVNAMVDFLFGKGVGVVSNASDVDRRRDIVQLLQAVFSANGGVGFFRIWRCWGVCRGLLIVWSGRAMI